MAGGAGRGWRAQGVARGRGAWLEGAEPGWRAGAAARGRRRGRRARGVARAQRAAEGRGAWLEGAGAGLGRGRGRGRSARKTNVRKMVREPTLLGC